MSRSEIQYKFNARLQDSLDEVKFHFDTNTSDKTEASLSEGTSLLAERQKLILLEDTVSEFGWKTVDDYVQLCLLTMTRT